MALVSLREVKFEETETPFSEPIKISIFCDCLKSLKEELKFEIIYLSNAED